MNDFKLALVHLIPEGYMPSHLVAYLEGCTTEKDAAEALEAAIVGTPAGVDNSQLDWLYSMLPSRTTIQVSTSREKVDLTVDGILYKVVSSAVVANIEVKRSIGTTPVDSEGKYYSLWDIVTAVVAVEQNLY